MHVQADLDTWSEEIDSFTERKWEATKVKNQRHMVLEKLDRLEEVRYAYLEKLRGADWAEMEVILDCLDRSLSELNSCL